MTRLLALTAILVLAAACSTAPREAPLPADPIAALNAYAARSGGADQEAIVARREFGVLVARLTAAEPALRARAAEELLRLVGEGNDLPLPVRAEFLRHEGLLAADEGSLRRVAAYLDDADLAPSALFALERAVPHPVAESLLIARLTVPSQVPPAAIARSLGAVRSTRAVEPLLALAAGAETATAEAARAALARIGDSRAEPVLRAALARGDRGATEDWLVFSDRQLTAQPSLPGDTAAAYREMLASPSAGIRLAGVNGLSLLGGAENAAALIVRLGDEALSVRLAAEAALIRIESPPGGPVDAQLGEALTRVDPRTQAGLLRVVTRRSGAAALPAVRTAAESPHAPARLTAIELLGEIDAPEASALLVRVAADPVEDVRAAAGNALLRAAARRMSDGDQTEALALLHRGLASASERRLLRSGLALARDHGSAETLAALQGLAGRKDLRDDVARARLGIADHLRGSQPKVAEQTYQEILATSQSRDQRQQAVAGLRALGADVTRFAARSGFLASWQILGPCDNCDPATLGSHPFGADGPTFAEAIEGAGAQRTWRPVTTDDPDGVVDLQRLEPHDNVTVYAAATIEWPADEDVTLKIGSDDGMAVWVNGELRKSKFAARGLTIDEDVVGARLRKGRNVILLRVHQGGGGWEFCVRITDSQGRPVDLSAR